MAQGIHGIPLFGLGEELHLTRLSRPCRTLLTLFVLLTENFQCNLNSFRFATVDLGGWDRLELTSPTPNIGTKYFVLRTAKGKKVQIK